MPSADTRLTRSLKQRRQAAFVLSICAACSPVVGILIAMSLPLVLDDVMGDLDIERLATILFLGSLVAVFVLLLMRVAVWRCPACGQALNGGLNQRFCGNCGVDFYDEHEEAELCEEAAPDETHPRDQSA